MHAISTQSKLSTCILFIALYKHWSIVSKESSADFVFEPEQKRAHYENEYFLFHRLWQDISLF